ncbi:MAG: KGG domain-containing protein [Chryseosolibacter sp.]
MAQKDGSGNNGARGFASMDDERKKRIASQGGLASAKGKNTSNRGFASMDKNKQREISSMGGKASRNLQSTSPEKNEEDTERNDRISDDKASERDLNSLEENNLESSGKTQGSLAYSETDEDEDEGLGDGNLGRSTRGDVLGK